MAITSGGGAAKVTVDVINAMWDQATAKSIAANSRISDAIALANVPPSMGAQKLDFDYKSPDIPKLPEYDPKEGESLYEDALSKQTTLIVNSMVDFLRTYFPNAPYFDAAAAWLSRALTSGGTGISTAVEQALWERGRARVLADSMRAEAEASETWANRRFPVPPGALTNQVNQIRLDAGRKLAEVSRDVSVKSFEAELQNVQQAVGQAIDLRMKAMAAAGDYIKTIMLAPQTAMQLATGLAGIRNDLARTLVSLYSAESAALEPSVRLAIADANLRIDGEKANLAAKLQGMDEKVKAAMEAAQMLGTQAAAGLNAIGGRASISGSDSSTV